MLFRSKERDCATGRVRRAKGREREGSTRESLREREKGEIERGGREESQEQEVNKQANRSRGNWMENSSRFTHLTHTQDYSPTHTDSLSNKQGVKGWSKIKYKTRGKDRGRLGDGVHTTKVSESSKTKH